VMPVIKLMMAACFAFVMFSEVCNSQEDGQRSKSFVAPPVSDESDSNAPLLSDEEIQALAARLVRGITFDLSDGNVRIRRWHKTKITFSIEYDKDLNADLLPPSEVTETLRSELNSIGRATNLEFVEQSSSGAGPADITFAITSTFTQEKHNTIATDNADPTKRALAVECGANLLSGEHQHCSIHSSLEDTKAAIEVDDGVIASSRCAIRHDLLKLCQGQTLLSALSNGRSMRDVCNAWRNYIFARSSFYNEDAVDSSIEHSLQGCLWSKRHFLAMSNVADNWRAGLRSKLNLCASQALGFVFAEEESSVPVPYFKSVPRIQVGRCTLQNLCQKVDAGAVATEIDPSKIFCAEQNSATGVRSALWAAYAIPPVVSSTAADVIYKLMSALKGTRRVQ
jgi:hypothetical protein